MRRRALHICCTLLAILLLCFSGLFWLFDTTAGARFAVTTLAGMAGLQVSVRGMDGRLLDHLHLTNVRLKQPNLQAHIDTLDLVWEPRQLLSGNILIRELNLSGVRIRDDSPPGATPSQLRWPQVNGTLRHLSAQISHLQLHDLSYRHLEAQPVIVTELSSTLAYNYGTLSLSAFNAVFPNGHASGELVAGFWQPSLSINIAMVPTQTVRGMDLFSLKARLLPGPDSEQLSGNITAIASSGGAQLLTFTTELEMAGPAFNLRRLSLTGPGRRGTLTGEGNITLTTKEPLLSLDLNTVDLDLKRELGLATDISGKLLFTGTLSRYQGSFALVNKGPGWQSASLAADYRGGTAGLKLAQITGTVLDGRLSGEVRVDWTQGIKAHGTLAGKGLNPGKVMADWSGLVDLDLTGNMELPQQGALRGGMRGKLSGKALSLGAARVDAAQLTLDGTLAQHTLDATISSSDYGAHAMLSGGYVNKVWRGELTELSGTDAIGPWTLAKPAPILMSRDVFRLSPMVISGSPDERIEVSGDLQLNPLSGDFQGTWSKVNLARANTWLEGVILTGSSSGALGLQTLPGKRVRLSGRADARGTVETEGLSVAMERVSATLEGDEQGLRAEANLALKDGGGEAHLSLDSLAPPSLRLPERGDLTLEWSDLDPALLRPMLPRELSVEGRLAGTVTGNLVHAGLSNLKGHAALAKGRVIWSADGQEFDAALDSTELAFGWPGSTGKSGGGLKLNGQASATGVYTVNGQRIVLDRSTLTLDAGQQGMRAGLQLAFDKGGALAGTFSSAFPADVHIPETGDLVLNWDGIDPSLLTTWLPGNLDLQGKLAGQAHGKLLPDRRLELVGEAIFTGGIVQLPERPEGVSSPLPNTSLTFGWRGETLQGKLSLSLAGYGNAGGSFLLPIPARFPVAANPKGGLQGTLSGKVRERGFFTAFFPGMVKESQGELDLKLDLAGTWSDPVLAGHVALANGSAYLPGAGISISDVQLSARLEGDQIRIDSFRAVSGSGHLEGTGLVRLKGWQVAGYSGSLSGERFQTLNLPELQMWSSPRLSFEGGTEKITVHGTLLIPRMLVSDTQNRTVVWPSTDVILEGVQPADRKVPLLLNGQIHLVLGEMVQVKDAGIDAQLDGTLDMELKGMNSIWSRGEIRVVKGRYRAYGMDLDIVRGRLYYVDGPWDEPNLDILALRTVGDVRAGVTVAGFLSEPIIKLYSEPPMSKADIMAYMLLGHPLDATNEQGSVAAMAATSALAYGDEGALQRRIKDPLGLNVLGVESVNPSSTGLMGYKEIPVSPSGMAPAMPIADQTQLTVGKYLTPKLYLSYGRSLATGGNLFMLRYDILQHWQIETQSGSESGVDLYYKLEFD